MHAVADCLQGLSAQAARALLSNASWREIGRGDWAWVFADPAGVIAARVVPFDPAYRMFAEDCQSGPANEFLPQVDAIMPLERDGFAVLMERLWPADEAAASALCAALAIGGASNSEGMTPAIDPALAADPDIADLRLRIEALLAKGRARFLGVWGGTDLRPANVMANRNGQLKLIDPVFLAGKKICEAVVAGRADLLVGLSRQQLLDFLDIAIFQPGGEAHAGRADLLARVERLAL